MNFGILVFDGVEELDFIGPWELLNSHGERHREKAGRFQGHNSAI